MANSLGVRLDVLLLDSFWAPRQAQLRDHTLPVLLDRLDAHGVVDNFRRKSGRSEAERRGLWFSDSDLYKWMEAAAWAGRLDLLEPVVEVVVAAAHPDGYLNTFYDSGVGSPPRYQDLGNSHEWYCGGHLIEAALAHHHASGSDALLDTATRWADHLCASFGPHADARVDGHPEVELALVRLARHTGQERYLAQAVWIIETQLAEAGLSIDDVQLAGHAVKALYLASAIAEVALTNGNSRYEDAASRLFASMVEEHSYPTGAVGGRWLDESVGKPYELPDAMAYAESCAAVAATQFCRRIWQLTGDFSSLEQTELLLFNAVPCGTGDDGESWFYSQPHAVADVASESNPWLRPYEYQQSMLLQWFPVHRHRWFDVTCCPTNLARMFATVHDHVADLDADGNLLIHLPIGAKLVGGGWDVEVASDYPAGGSIRITTSSAPPGRRTLVRKPSWGGWHRGTRLFRPMAWIYLSVRSGGKPMRELRAPTMPFSFVMDRSYIASRGGTIPGWFSTSYASTRPSHPPLRLNPALEPLGRAAPPSRSRTRRVDRSTPPGQDDSVRRMGKSWPYAR